MTKSGTVYDFTKNLIIALYVYLFILLVLGISLTLFILLQPINDETLFPNSLIISLSCCNTFCSIHYLKKLYKASIDKRISLLQDASLQAKCTIWGNFIYFFLRPLFASAFTIIAIIAFKAGIIVVTNPSTEINEKFLYVCALISSIVGFSIGDILDKFNLFSSEIISKTLDNSKGGTNND